VIESWDRTVFIIAYFASCLLGVWMFNTSTDPAVSFTGYNLVVVPFGLIVNLVVSRYDPDVVLQAVETTALVTVGMMTLGSLFPRLFAAARGSLAIALLLTLAIQVTRVMLFHWDPSLYDWVIVVVFCGYIGYDWGRAQRIPPTVDNAIDSAAEIYMDVINLFLRICASSDAAGSARARATSSRISTCDVCLRSSTRSRWRAGAAASRPSSLRSATGCTRACGSG
jgi:FtsH-binding integral membrane protein